MEDLGTEKVLMDDRMGHIDGSVSARYAHVTAGMRNRCASSTSFCVCGGLLSVALAELVGPGAECSVPGPTRSGRKWKSSPSDF
jgi:hypothetical protein